MPKCQLDINWKVSLSSAFGAAAVKIDPVIYFFQTLLACYGSSDATSRATPLSLLAYAAMPMSRRHVHVA